MEDWHKKRFEDEQKKIEEELKKYEPNDLSAVEKSCLEAINISKNKKLETPEKISQLILIFEKMDLIINNYKAGYDFLERRGANSMLPEEFKDDVERAENFKRQVEIKIYELRLAKSEDSKVPHVPELKEASPIGKTSEPELNFLNRNLTLGEAAEVLGVHVSTLYHDLPEDMRHMFKVGGKYSIPLNQLPELRKAINSKIPAAQEPASKIKPEKKYHFIFKVDLKPFTDDFVKRGYITEENAKLFAERFKDCYLIDSDNDHKIEWEGKMIYLTIFIFISDKLKLIEMSDDDRREDTNSKEKYIPLEPFFNNFNIRKGGVSETAISNNKVKVLDALNSIEEKAKLKNKNKPLLFKEAIKMYLDKEIKPADKYKNGIDYKIVEIAYKNQS
jgi:hypothetical protein